METQETAAKHGDALDKAAAAYFALLRDCEARGVEPDELDLFDVRQCVENVIYVYQQDGVPNKEIEAMVRRNGFKQ
jgi:hypothetical protein